MTVFNICVMLALIRQNGIFVSTQLLDWVMFNEDLNNLTGSYYTLRSFSRQIKTTVSRNVFHPSHLISPCAHFWLLSYSLWQVHQILILKGQQSLQTTRGLQWAEMWWVILAHQPDVLSFRLLNRTWGR